jgi:hypothetical protein
MRIGNESFKSGHSRREILVGDSCGTYGHVKFQIDDGYGGLSKDIVVTRETADRMANFLLGNHIEDPAPYGNGIVTERDRSL